MLITFKLSTSFETLRKAISIESIHGYNRRGNLETSRMLQATKFRNRFQINRVNEFILT